MLERLSDNRSTSFPSSHLSKSVAARDDDSGVLSVDAAGSKYSSWRSFRRDSEEGSKKVFGNDNSSSWRSSPQDDDGQQVSVARYDSVHTPDEAAADVVQVSDHSVIASSLVSESRPCGVDGSGHRDEVASRVSLNESFVGGGHGSGQDYSTVEVNKSVLSPPFPPSGAMRDEHEDGSGNFSVDSPDDGSSSWRSGRYSDEGHSKSVASYKSSQSSHDRRSDEGSIKLESSPRRFAGDGSFASFDSHRSGHSDDKVSENSHLESRSGVSHRSVEDDAGTFSDNRSTSFPSSHLSKSVAARDDDSGVLSVDTAGSKYSSWRSFRRDSEEGSKTVSGNDNSSSWRSSPQDDDGQQVSVARYDSVHTPDEADVDVVQVSDHSVIASSLVSGKSSI